MDRSVLESLMRGNRQHACSPEAEPSPLDDVPHTESGPRERERRGGTHGEGATESWMGGLGFELALLLLPPTSSSVILFRGFCGMGGPSPMCATSSSRAGFGNAQSHANKLPNHLHKKNVAQRCALPQPHLHQSATCDCSYPLDWCDGRE